MWAYCAGSLIPNVLAEDSSGEEAAIGTVAHEVSEIWLKSGNRPSHLIGEIRDIVAGKGDRRRVYSVEITEEMLDYCQRYVEWCQDEDGDHYVEVRVDYSDLTPIPDQGGTSDHICARPGVLTVTDLKFGQGVEVYAEKNTQCILYAYGAFRLHDDDYDFQKIVIRIAQPRRDHFDEWELTRQELLEWTEWLKDRAHIAWSHNAPRTPGSKQCQWCRVRKDCGAYVAWLDQFSEGVFDNLDAEMSEEVVKTAVARLDESNGDFINPPSLTMLTLEQKAKLYTYRKMMEKFFEDLGNDLYQKLMQGDDVPYWKLVEGRTTRSFPNQEAVAEHLEWLGLDEDQYNPRTFQSPAQVEELLLQTGYRRKQLPVLLKPYCKNTASQPTMVSAGDKRPALIMGDQDVFDDLDDDL